MKRNATEPPNPGPAPAPVATLRDEHTTTKLGALERTAAEWGSLSGLHDLEDTFREFATAELSLLTMRLHAEHSSPEALAGEIALLLEELSAMDQAALAAESSASSARNPGRPSDDESKRVGRGSRLGALLRRWYTAFRPRAGSRTNGPSSTALRKDLERRLWSLKEDAARENGCVAGANRWSDSHLSRLLALHREHHILGTAARRLGAASSPYVDLDRREDWAQ